MWKPHFLLSPSLYNAIPVATATFNDSFLPNIGISTILSAYDRIFLLRPLTSLPTIRASGNRGLNLNIFLLFGICSSAIIFNFSFLTFNLRKSRHVCLLYSHGTVFSAPSEVFKILFVAPTLVVGAPTTSCVGGVGEIPHK